MSKAHRKSGSSVPSIQKKITDLAEWGDFEADQDVQVGSTGDHVHVVWKKKGKIRTVFHIYEEGDISVAISCLKKAQQHWVCNVCLVVKSVRIATDASWNADFYGLRNFRSIAISELGKSLPKNKVLRKWLEI